MPALFGKDSQPHLTSQFFSIVSTIALWIILFLVLIFVPVKEEKPKYKTVQIVLDAPVLEKKIDADSANSTPAPASSEVQQIQENISETVTESVGEMLSESVPVPASIAEPAPEPVVETKVETKPAVQTKTSVEKTVEKKTEPANKVETVKKAEPKKVETPKQEVIQKIEPVEDVVLSKSVEELMAEQFQPKKKKEFDWSMFDDDVPQEIENQPEPAKVHAKNELSGSAGGTVQQPAKRQTSQTVSETQSENASSVTSSNLSKIAATESVSSQGFENISDSNKKTSSLQNGGSDDLEWSGKHRNLIEPKKPVITLSASSASLIDATKTVKIRFIVVGSGNVPRGDISITPESILPSSVREEIKDQISKWRFEAADESSTAVFDYTIIKK